MLRAVAFDVRISVDFCPGSAETSRSTTVAIPRWISAAVRSSWATVIQAIFSSVNHGRAANAPPAKQMDLFSDGKQDARRLFGAGDT